MRPKFFSRYMGKGGVVRRITVADMALLLSLVTVNGVLYALPAKESQQHGATVEVTNADAGEKYSYPIHSNQNVQVQGRYGYSVIEIAEGRTRFTSSPCRRKICIHAGWLQFVGQWAACLENGISLQIQGSENQYDSISY